MAETRIPARILRLLPHEDPARVGRSEHREFLVLRLLEEGDGEDLRWLCGETGRTELAAALRRGGGRHLARRNRRFWEIVLETPAPPPSATELWPLA